jgi:hypothetical protein
MDVVRLANKRKIDLLFCFDGCRRSGVVGFGPGQTKLFPLQVSRSQDRWGLPTCGSVGAIGSQGCFGLQPFRGLRRIVAKRLRGPQQLGLIPGLGRLFFDRDRLVLDGNRIRCRILLS